MIAPGFTIAAAPSSTLGRTDLTRRWAIADPTRTRFAGVTRVEAVAAIPVIEGLSQADLDQALIRVELGVVLSDGAGPYLVDASGSLVLVVGSHGVGSDTSVAIGEACPRHDIGLVAPVGAGVWLWRVSAPIDPTDRIAALDALAECGDVHAAESWEFTWRAASGDGPSE
jgi:hypothetical protein